MVALAVFGVKKYYAKVKFWIGSHSNYDDLISVCGDARGNIHS
jgi:hypothetical protein